MRQKEILLNIQPLSMPDDDLDDGHVLSSFETPLRADAFELDDEVKIERIEKTFSGDNDDSWIGSHRR